MHNRFKLFYFKFHSFNHFFHLFIRLFITLLKHTLYLGDFIVLVSIYFIVFMYSFTHSLSVCIDYGPPPVG